VASRQSLAEAIAADEVLRARLAVFRRLPETDAWPVLAPIPGIAVDPVSG
jgi:hypothetical protein